MPLPSAHYLDELATAYVQSLAAAASGVIAISHQDYGVDGTLKQVVQDHRGRYIETGCPIDFQLKATAAVLPRDAGIAYDLKARNFDLIVARSPLEVPYFLFLICFPPEQDAWLRLEPERLILNASAYWWTAFGAYTANRSSVRIEISKSQRLTPDAISAMLKMSKERFR